jgi:hypothetical protein
MQSHNEEQTTVCVCALTLPRRTSHPEFNAGKFCTAFADVHSSFRGTHNYSDLQCFSQPLETERRASLHFTVPLQQIQEGLRVQRRWPVVFLLPTVGPQGAFSRSRWQMQLHTLLAGLVGVSHHTLGPGPPGPSSCSKLQVAHDACQQDAAAAADASGSVCEVVL